MWRKTTTFVVFFLNLHPPRRSVELSGLSWQTWRGEDLAVTSSSSWKLVGNFRWSRFGNLVNFWRNFVLRVSDFISWLSRYLRWQSLEANSVGEPESALRAAVDTLTLLALGGWAWAWWLLWLHQKWTWAYGGLEMAEPSCLLFFFGISQGETSISTQRHASDGRTRSCSSKAL